VVPGSNSLAQSPATLWGVPTGGFPMHRGPPVPHGPVLCSSTVLTMVYAGLLVLLAWEGWPVRNQPWSTLRALLAGVLAAVVPVAAVQMGAQQAHSPL